MFENIPSVLMSIQPQWCELIASGKKTVEVRKTKPKLETPFKVYVYCTNTKTIGDFILCKSEENAKLFGYNTAKGINKGFAKNEDIQLKGKVIGEFVCDMIYELHDWLLDPRGVYQEVEEENLRKLLKMTQLTYDELCLYRNGMPYYKPLYAWHISNLVIYDKPKELSDFKKINQPCWYGGMGLSKRDCPECKNKECFIQRPPQSWCYVERVGEM